MNWWRGLCGEVMTKLKDAPGAKAIRRTFYADKQEESPTPCARIGLNHFTFPQHRIPKTQIQLSSRKRKGMRVSLLQLALQKQHKTSFCYCMAASIGFATPIHD
jgi:hypothetical protein